VLLALTRRLTNQDRAADALVALDSAVTLGAALARDGDLRDVVAGWRLERDAASMLAGDTVFGESGGRRAAAVRWVAWADSVLPQLRDLNRLIETAAAGPASLGQLAELAADGRLPLATRRNIVRAIEWGWADNPMEKAYGISDQRDSALRRLSREVLPPRLAADVAGALTRGRPAYMSRVLLVPIVERQRREFQEE
jgi:hypothetical protein